MKIREIIISLVIFSGIIIGMSNFYIDLSTTYDKSPTDLASFNASSDVHEKTEAMREMVESSRGGVIGFVWSGLQIIYNVVLMPLDFIIIISAIVTDLAMTVSIPIPIWFTGIIVSIVMITIIYEIISILMKKDI